MRIYRLTQDWVEDEATWNERAIGVAWGAAGADGAASNAGVAVTGDCTTTGLRLIDLTRFVQEWSDGAPNYGVVFTDSGTDGVDFDSSESATSPVLTVIYKSSQLPVATQALSGTSAIVSFPATLADRPDLLLERRGHRHRRASRAGRQRTSSSRSMPASPDAPVLVSPPDGATGVASRRRCRPSVSNPAGGSLDVSVALRRGGRAGVHDHRAARHAALLGGVSGTSSPRRRSGSSTTRTRATSSSSPTKATSSSTTASLTEWQRANTSMSMLDGVVPYGMGPGNHDLPTTLYNQYFPYTRYQGQSVVRRPLPGRRTTTTISCSRRGGMDFVIVHLAFCPPAAAVAWADSVFKALPGSHRHHDDARVSGRSGAAHRRTGARARSTSGTAWRCRIRICASC